MGTQKSLFCRSANNGMSHLIRETCFVPTALLGVGHLLIGSCQAICELSLETAEMEVEICSAPPLVWILGSAAGSSTSDGSS